MPGLAEMIGREPDLKVSLRQGVVTADPAANGTVTVRLAGASASVSGIRRLGAAAVWKNDVVWVLQQGHDLLVIGRVADGQWGTAQFTDGLEIYHWQGTPYVDFHRAANAAGDSNADYNVRLINDVSGWLTLKGKLRADDGVTIGGDWFRVVGNGGIHWENHGGGWFMQDSTWIRTYGDKAILAGQEIKTTGGRFNARDLAGMGQHGVHTTYAWFGHWAYRDSAAHYGFIHNGPDALMSGDGCYLRYQNGNRLLTDVNGVHLFGLRFVLNDAVIYTRAWNDANHYMQWHGNVDGLYIKEYGGVQVDTRDGFGMRIDHSNTMEMHRFDQVGAWNTMAFHGKASGGGSPCGIAFWEAGRGCAPFWKSWFEALEARNNPNTDFCTIRGFVDNRSSIRSKANVKNMDRKLARGPRKEKVKKVRTVHFNRTPTYGGCANCVATGLARNNERLIRDPDATVPKGNEPCPDCGGKGKELRRPHEEKNEQEGWFGFVAEEIETEFPEAVHYREDEDGVVRPSGLDTLALTAILWEEIKDLEDRLAAVEGRAK